MPPTHSELARWFAEEIQPHERSLRAWLKFRFPKRSDIDDLVQEAYLRLFRAKGSGRLSHDKAYLFATAGNLAIDGMRRQRGLSFESLTETSELSVLEDRPDAATSVDREKHLETLAAAIRALPERCREVLVLRKHHGLSHREIADRLGISPHTVNAQITIAMMKCREYFRSRGLVGPAP